MTQRTYSSAYHRTLSAFQIFTDSQCWARTRRIWRTGLVSRLLLCLGSVLLTMAIAHAQNPDPTDAGAEIGFKPLGSYHGSLLENVDLYTGNLHIEIPLVTLKARGHETVLRLSYNSLIYFTNHSHDGDLTQIRSDIFANPSFGWNLTSQEGLAEIGQIQNQVMIPGQDPTVAQSIQITEPDGSQHTLMGENLVYETSCNTAYQSIDSSYIRLVFANNQNCSSDSPTIYFKDGATWQGGNVEDTNGNVYGTDDLGRTFTVSYNGSPYTSGTIGYKASDGSGSTITMGFTVYELRPSGHGPVPTALLSSIQLANKRSYQFLYDTNGELSKITLPDGGYIRYVYGLTGYHSEDEATSLGVVSTRALSADGVNEQVWGYEYTAGSPKTTTVTDPLGETEYREYNSGVQLCSPCDSLETKVVYKDASAKTLRTVTKTYVVDSQPLGFSWAKTGNPRLSTVTTILDDNQTQSMVSYDNYDNYGNVKTKKEYDYDGSLLRTTSYSYLHESQQAYVTAHILQRVSAETISGPVGPGSQTQYEYDNYAHFTGGMQASGAVQHDANYNTNYSVRGNVTATNQWRNTDNTWLSTYYEYDDAGNVLETQDPRGGVTQTSYADSWANSTCAPAGGNAAAYATKITNALNQITNLNYNSCTGTTASIKDPNLQSTTMTYDSSGRSTETDYADGGSTKQCYTDSGGSNCTQSGPPYSVINTSALSVSPAAINKKTTVQFDGLGRISTTTISDPNGDTSTTITYDSLGRQYQVYNPARCSSQNCESTWGYKTFHYDGLSRVTSVVEQDSSSTISMFYSANYATVTDESGNTRKTKRDSLRRVKAIWEAPGVSGYNFETDYTYDAFGNLWSVTQNGSGGSARNRSFVYDSMSHLITAANPESGTICYGTWSGNNCVNGYDGNGNVVAKTEPPPNQQQQQVTISYTYDLLNRLLSKTYTGMTMPTIQYGYDGNIPTGCTLPQFNDGNPKGRRTSMCDGSGVTVWSHDPLGRVLNQEEIQYTSNSTSVTELVQYGYNLDGSVKQIVYPSGRTLNYAYTPPQGSISAGRQVSAIDSTGPINYVTQGTYAPQGALAGFVFGQASGSAGTTGSNAFNNLLRITSQTATNSSQQLIFSLSYGYNTNNDNGNILKVTNGLDSSRNIVYGYDALNRIAQANTVATSGSNCWAEAYTIDPWGNLTGRSGVGGWAGCRTEGLSASVNGNNQIIGWCYDAAGNLLDMGGCGNPQHSYVYDADGQLQSPPAVGIGSGMMAYTYYYDGDGKRVQKCDANPCIGGLTAGTLYWMGVQGEVLDESDRSGNMTEEYIYFAGQRVARRDISTNNVHYYFNDQVESPRVITDDQGNVQQQTDYYPYGGIAFSSGGDSNRYKFTGKERDSESGLDNFGARYNASTMGRFMSPDPGNVGVNRLNPQSWNAYSYSLNNPLSLTDPTGLYVCEDSVNCDSANDKAFAKSLADAQTAANKLTGDDQAAAQRAIDAYGAQGVDNGVNVRFDANVTGGVTEVSGVANGENDKENDNPNKQNINVTFNPNAVGDASLVAHEGSHVADGSAWVSSGFSANMNPTNLNTELNAYHVQFNILNSLSAIKAPPGMVPNGGFLNFKNGQLSWHAEDTFKGITPDLQKKIEQNYENSALPAFQKGSVVPR